MRSEIRTIVLPPPCIALHTTSRLHRYYACTPQYPSVRSPVDILSRSGLMMLSGIISVGLGFLLAMAGNLPTFFPNGVTKKYVGIQM